MSITEKQRSAAEAYIEKLILPSDPLMPLWNKENIIFRKRHKWNYIDNCMIKAIIMLSEIVGDNRLAEKAAELTDSYLTENGDIPTFSADDFNLDNICGGSNLLWLWRNTGKEKYLAAAELLMRGQLQRQPRTVSGNYWHKAVYPQQVWLDGVYMALPFAAEYAAMNGDKELEDDIVRQLSVIREKMRDDVTGLYYHGLDESGKMSWADKVKGTSSEFWLRSMGWLAAGLVDICNIMPGSAEDMLAGLLSALSENMTPEGMLMQLPLRKELADNYPESSGTLLFAYSAMKAARLGIVGTDTGAAGKRAFGAVSEGYIRFSPEGMPVLRNICLMAGLGGEPFRDGSAGYYLSEQIVENDAKGIAPYLMAYAESCMQK